MEDITNRKPYALITGGTSGIGYELARQAALNNYNLIIIARDEEFLEDMRSEFQQFDIDIKVIQKDLFEENAAKEIYDEVRNYNVEILINNAGQGQLGFFTDVELSRHLKIIKLNIIALVSLTHCFLRDFVKNNRGRILQLGSEVSKNPMPKLSVYAATKAFVLSFTEAIRNEIKDTDVTITLLMPGATDTDFFDKANMEQTLVYNETDLDAPEEVARLGFEALLKGKRRIIGPAGKKNVIMANLSPDNVVANKNRKMMEPAKEKKRDKPGHRKSLENKEKKSQERTHH